MDKARARAPFTRGIYMDVVDGSGRVPAIGHYVVTKGKRGIGSAYLIVRVRKVNRRDPASPPRYMMRVTHVDLADAMAAAEAERFTLYWYPRVKVNS